MASRDATSLLARPSRANQARRVGICVIGERNINIYVYEDPIALRSMPQVTSQCQKTLQPPHDLGARVELGTGYLRSENIGEGAAGNRRHDPADTHTVRKMRLDALVLQLHAQGTPNNAQIH